jgi:putative exporter of polyketide antibiotics
MHLHLLLSFVALGLLDILTVSERRFNIGTVVDTGKRVLPAVLGLSGTN